MRRVIVLGIAIVIAFSTAGCSSSDGPSTTITVGAASSLTDVFAAIGEDFTRDNPDIAVRFSFAGSSAIAEQITEGAPMDVFASAGTTSMQPLIDAGRVGDVSAFAENSLQIAVPPGNPAGVSGLGDLAHVTLLLCQEQVPCGAAAQRLFEKNSLSVSPASLEPDVRSVLTKVEADEADAGIVYVTDVRAAGDSVMGIAIPDEQNVTTLLQAAVVTDSAHRDAALAFVGFLTSPEAQERLAAAGFAAP